MKLVMTLLARDEADVVGAHVAFHLAAGVDFVIATDHRSEDGTTEILEEYERLGRLHLIREPGEELRQRDWVTRMARLAAKEYDADWVINSDADEFWWPRGGDLKEVLRAVPARYGIAQAFVRNFVPRVEDGRFFADRMVYRISPQAPLNDPASPWRPTSKVAHRADPDVRVARGNHAIVAGDLQPLRGWHPIEVLHFPMRSLEQYGRKARHQSKAFAAPGSRPGTAYHAKANAFYAEGKGDEYFASMAVADDELDHGLRAGTLVQDTRLRDALAVLRTDSERDAEPTFWPASSGASGLEFPKPSVIEDVLYAVDAAVLGEADVQRAQRRLDELEARIARVEGRSAIGISRRFARRLTSMRH
ncbi:MAG: glycosyltransferase family 2 protein [Thermoleophilia bacterium]|nr:glycosyltransferase family 2 protein [Thermoleophilia bacterium]MDH5280565.1 glycosyltransferase family 2 protein [Thermoleophilia bacterium]